MCRDGCSHSGLPGPCGQRSSLGLTPRRPWAQQQGAPALLPSVPSSGCVASAQPPVKSPKAWLQVGGEGRDSVPGRPRAWAPYLEADLLAHHAQSLALSPPCRAGPVSNSPPDGNTELGPGNPERPGPIRALHCAPSLLLRRLPLTLAVAINVTIALASFLTFPHPAIQSAPKCSPKPAHHPPPPAPEWLRPLPPTTAASPTGVRGILINPDQIMSPPCL